MWNYRIVNLSQDGDPWFEVREVFYNDDGTCAGHANATLGDEYKDRLDTVLHRIADSLTRHPEVLNQSDFVGFKDDENFALE